MAERFDSRTRGFGDPVPFWLAILARVFAVLGLPFFIWTSGELIYLGIVIPKTLSILHLEGPLIVLGLILIVESMWTFIFEVCYFIPARIISPRIREFLEEGRTTYMFRTLFYCIPLALLWSYLKLFGFDGRKTILIVGSGVSSLMLIISAHCYAYCIFLHIQTGTRRVFTLRPPTTFK